MIRPDLRRWSLPAIAVVSSIGLAAAALVLRRFTAAQLVSSLHRLAPAQLAQAALFTAGSYLALTGYDYFGTRWAGGRIAYRRVALASFVSMAIGHTAGMAPFSSAAIRYRFYSRWGLDGHQVAMVVLFSGLTVAAGQTMLAAVLFLGFPELVRTILPIGGRATALLGGTAGAAVMAYVGLNLVRHRPFRLASWTVALPGWRLAAVQIALGVTDCLLMASALQALLASGTPIGFVATAAAWLLGSLATLMTHVPGGIGVLEATIVALAPNGEVIGPLIAFRIISYLGPFAFGVIGLAVSELRERLAHRADQRARLAHRADQRAQI